MFNPTGTGPWVGCLVYGLSSTILTLDLADASPNFTTATIFNDSPTSGFGGWGNPSDDYQITTGAFANDFELAYPVPHRIRRNYTVRSLSADPFGDGTAPAPDDFWNYITPESQKQLINGYVGDFEGFQMILEGSTVSRSSEVMTAIYMWDGGHTTGDSADAVYCYVLGRPRCDPPDARRVSHCLRSLFYPLFRGG